LQFEGFNNVLKKLGAPKKPIPAPTTNLPSFITSSDEEALEGDSERWLENFSVPQLHFIKNYPNEADLAPAVTLGGESAGLQRMQQYLKNKKRARDFKKPDTNPSLMLSETPSDREGETALTSPYLKFGCLSPRLFYWELQKIYAEGPHSNPPESLEGQLLWREFFTTMGYAYPNFDKIEGNPICRQIQWDDNAEFFDAWKEGRTGYPWIDAIMRQLREQGWMHHLARHCVACFLTRGDLYQSWLKGVQVFDQLLIDADWSLNNGNWMWLSASAFYHQYWRVYSPISFGQKYDPDGKLIRRFVPELKNFPAKFIYEPWTAPIKTQKDAGCIIGQDYPKPIVDHKEVSKKCIARMKAAYEGSAIVDGMATKAVKKEEKDDDDDGETRKKPAPKRPSASSSTLDKFVGAAKRLKKE
jgi:cryptochrome